MKKKWHMEFYRVIVKCFFGLFMPVKVYDADKLIKEGGGILAANHKSLFDMFMIGVKIPRYPHWMAKKELFKNRIFAKIITGCGAFPVDRGTADVGAVKTATALLKSGELVGIFPEGTRNKEGKRDIRVHAGVAKFAIEANVPVQPVAVWGKYRIFSRLYVRFGDPFYLPPNDPEHPYTKADYINFACQILDKCYDLMEKPDGNN